MPLLASIRYKLIIWFLSVFSVVFTGLGIFLYYELEEIVIGSVDSHLSSEVQLLIGLLGEEEEHGHLEKEVVELSEAAVGEYAVPLSGYYYQIVLTGGEIIGQSPSLSSANKSLPFDGESFTPSYKTITGPEKGPLRLMSQSFKFDGDTVTIQVADTLKESYHLLYSFRNIILITIPLIFIFSVAGIWIITGWSIGSLKRLSGKIEEITEMNLNERVKQDGMDKELLPLVDSFNTMLARIEESFSRHSRFLSDASHELRTPTSVIKSYCDVTLGRERTPAEYQESLRMIGEMAGKMSDIINRILEVSRQEAKTSLLRLLDVDLMDIIGDAVKLLQPFASSRGIMINLKGERVRVKGDRERLTEVFTNIVDNAIKYNKYVPEGFNRGSGGVVDSEVGARDGWGIVKVADTGIGIPAAEKERIFDRFYRLETNRGAVAGSGLGLSIVKAIVHAHGGRIEVESEVGKGSIFTIFLPQKGKS